MQIIIDKNFEARPSIEDLINKMGRNFSFSKNNYKYETNKDFFEKSLNKFFKNNNLSLKIKKLFDLFQKSKNIEIIQKSSIGKNFVNFINPKKSNFKKEELKNIAIIAKFENNIKENETPANSIILTVNFVRNIIQENKVQFYCKLIGIDISLLQKEKYLHPNVIHLSSKIEFLDYNEINKESLLIQRQDLQELLKLRKSLDIWEDQSLDVLKLRDFSQTIEMLHKFLETKRNLFYFPFYIKSPNDNLINGNDINFKKGKEFNLFVINQKNYKFNLNKNKKEVFFLGNKDNENLKVSVESSKIISHKKLYLDEKNKIEEKIKLFEKRQIDLKKNISKNFKQIEELVQEIEKEKENLKILYSKRNNLKSQLQEKEEILYDLDDKITNLNNNIKKIENEIKNNKNNIKNNKNNIKKIKQKIPNYNIQLKIKNEINNKIEIEKEIKKIKENISLNKKIYDQKEEIESKEKEIENKKTQIEEIKENISNKRKKIYDNKNEISNFYKKIQELESCEKQFDEKKLAIFKLNIFVASKKHKTNAVENMTMPVSKWIHILTNEFKKNINDYSYTFSDYDVGMSRIIERYLFTLKAYRFGEFKSPYAALSLDNPNVPIKINNDVNIDGIELNEGQQKAINSFNNAHFASFLQGPPGTGKTQVISVAIINAINQGKNVVISSSTNAAIDNAMERVNKIRNNPNIFMLRHSSDATKLLLYPEFSSNALYKNFLERVDCYVLQNKNNFSKEDPELEKFLKNDDFISKYYPNIDIQKFLEKQEEPFIKKLFEKFYSKNEYTTFEYAIHDINNVFERYRIILKQKFLESQKLCDQFFNKYKDSFSFNYIEDTIYDFYLKVKKILKKIKIINSKTLLKICKIIWKKKILVIK